MPLDVFRRLRRRTARGSGHRLTATGFGMAASAVVLLVGGALAGYAELLMLGVAAALAIGLAAVATVFRPELDVHRDIAPTCVTRGEIALGQVEVSNPAGRPAAVTTAIDRVGGTDIVVSLPRLRARQSRTTTYQLPTTRRGRISVGPLRIVRADPLGLIRAEQSYGETATLVVHPRVYPIATLPAGRTRSMEGPTAERAPQGSITFHALRPYVPGDDLRQVHWKSTARTGDLMVRQLVDTSQVEMGIVLDSRRSAHPDEESFEELVDVAASLAAAAAGHRFPVRIYAGRDASAVLRKPSALLDWLAGVSLSDADDLAGFDAVGRTRQHDTMFVLAGRLTTSELHRIAAVRHRYASVVLISLRPDAVVAPTPRVPGVLTLDVMSAAQAVAKMQGIRW